MQRFVIRNHWLLKCAESHIYKAINSKYIQRKNGS